MPSSLKKSWKDANKAGDAWKKLLERQNRDGFFTRDQQTQKRNTFVDNHVGLFDDYYDAIAHVHSVHADPGKYGTLNTDARRLATAIAMRHPNSESARQIIVHPADPNADSRLNTGGGLQALVRETYEAHAEGKLSGTERENLQNREKRLKERLRRKPLEDAQRELQRAQAALERLQREVKKRPANIRSEEEDDEFLGGSLIGGDEDWEDPAIRAASDRVRAAEQRVEEEQNRLDQGEEQEDQEDERLSDGGSSSADPDEMEEGEQERNGGGLANAVNPEAGLNKGLTRDQEKGLMEIGAWMYRNARHGVRGGKNDRTPFVEGILNRSAREKLLMYYMIEFDKLHSISTPVILVSQEYVPSVDRFRSKMRGHFWKYFSKNYFQWDKLTDAAMAAGSAKHFLGSLGSLKSYSADRPGAHAAAAPGGEAGEIREGEEENLIEIGGEEQGRDLDPQELQLKQNLEQRLQGVIAAAQVATGENPPPDAGQLLLDRLEELEELLQEDEADGLEGAREQAENPSGPSGKKSGVGKTKKVHDVLKMLFDYVKTPCQQTSKMLKQGMKIAEEGSKTAGNLKTSTLAFNWAAMPVTVLSALVSAVNVFITCYECAHTGADITTAEKAFKVFLSGKSIVDFGSGTYSSVTSIAGLAGAGWTSAGGATAAAWVGIATGTLTTAVGIHNLDAGGDQEARSREANEALKRKDPAMEMVLSKQGQDLSPEEQKQLEAQKEALEGRRQMLLHITNAGTKSAERQEITAGLQMLQGGIQVLSGILALGGVTAFASAGAALLSFVVGIIATGVDSKMRKGERKAVIDEFLGMDRLYSTFVTEQRRALSEAQFRARYGKEKDIRTMLRKEAEGVLGFQSDEKLYSQIMWFYAKGLYQGCFLKDDGTVLTNQERAAETGARKTDRDLCMKTLKSYGLKLRTPDTADEEPVPGISAIYKKMMA